MTEFITNFLQMLVRTIFGTVIGSFFGLMVGGLIEVMLWIDKKDFQLLEEMTLFVAIGAMVGALLGASNTLGVKERPIISRSGWSVGGQGEGHVEGEGGGDGGSGNGGGSGGGNGG